MRVFFGAMLLLIGLGMSTSGCGSDACGAWSYAGCCGAGNQAQFVRTCMNPDGSESVQHRCSGTCM